MGTSPFNGNRAATTARSFHGQIFAELTPPARRRPLQQGCAGAENQIEWSPELIQIGVINFCCGSKPAVCNTLKKGLLMDVEQTKSMGKRTSKPEGALLMETTRSCPPLPSRSMVKPKCTLSRSNRFGPYRKRTFRPIPNLDKLELAELDVRASAPGGRPLGKSPTTLPSPDIS